MPLDAPEATTHKTETTQETTSAATQAAPPAPSPPLEPWNGELDALDKLPWWSTVPEAARTNLRSGYESKVKNLEKGYQEKYRGAAEERKKLEAERKEVENQRRRVDLLQAMYGGDEAKAAAIEAELTELRSYKTASEKRAAEQYEAAVKAEEEKISASYGDILKNDEAAGFFERLVAADIDLEEAAQIVRAKFPSAAPEKDPWDRATKVVSKGDGARPAGGGGVRFNGNNLDDVMADAVERAASRTRGR